MKSGRVTWGTGRELEVRPEGELLSNLCRNVQTFQRRNKIKTLKSSQTWKYLQGTEYNKQTGQL